ncbi:hypothetical protein FGG08_002538 [Glutinoglossum americanum]|uniref:nicotinate phosphoribosyltransferase n=1 Tax=Glutinoglossum americanum TaxID=1670608 RepID=A0A9P8IBF6_9PEZI|nr:hypothetical protein FGG08_002538 [Glutinoglossum americanum]
MQNPGGLPGAIFSLLDTDLYKLTMQCAVLRYFPDVGERFCGCNFNEGLNTEISLEVTYNFTNRTPDLKFSRAAFLWLEAQIGKLGNITISSDELEFLRKSCPYLGQEYIDYLSTFQLDPSQQITLSFHPVEGHSGEENGEVMLGVRGLWVETILYEIPLLALTSEAYFRFCDRAWAYDGQEETAYRKGVSLLHHGIKFSEFGTRRRRDYHTQDLVLEGLIRAVGDSADHGWKGRLLGTSNVHFAHKYGIVPVGTIAHEWFMGIAAITNDYLSASETALECWVGCFGEGVLGVTLTDTFGTPVFLESFKKPIGSFDRAELGDSGAPVSTPASIDPDKVEGNTKLQARSGGKLKTYAEVFTGVRQDSGDPAGFVRMVREFYDSIGVKDKKTIVFSDSLNIELCVKYMAESEKAGFDTTFGIGTYLTNDFINTSTGKKSVPLNIVIKLSSAAGRPAIKISDNIGKNTGDPQIVERVKRMLGYVEKDWEGGDEKVRWGRANGSISSNSPDTVM